MPYGSKNETFVPTVDAVNYYPGGSSTYHDRVTGSLPKHGSVNWSRGGTAYNSGKLSKAERVRSGHGRFIEVSFLDYRNAYRLRQKIFIPKLGRYVHKKVPVLQKRLKFVPSKVKGYRGLDIPPNALHFLEQSVAYYGIREIYSYNSYYDGWYRKHYGDLCSDWIPIGSYSPLSGNFAGVSSALRHPYTTSRIAALDSAGLSKLYERVKNQDVNIGQMIAERHQTIKMFGDAVKRVSGFILDVKRGRVSTAFRHLFPQKTIVGNVSDLWLVKTYGIDPLLNDIDGMAKYLATPQEMQRDISVVKKEKFERVLVDSFDDGFVNTKVYVTAEISVKYKCRLRIYSEGFTALSQLGFGNPLSLAWEMMPWSFVIDWALPIGNYLNNLDAFSGLNLLFTTKTTFSKETIIFERSFGGSDIDHYVYADGKCGAIITRTKVEREILSEIPPLPSPTLKDPSSRQHMANFLALLAQRIKRK